MLVVPTDHPLAQRAPAWTTWPMRPLITYHPPSPGARSTTPLQPAKLTPRIVLEAIDSDVIKTYVRLGMGRASWPRWPCATTRWATWPCAPWATCWPERGPRGLQARRLPAQLCLKFAELLSDRREPRTDCPRDDGPCQRLRTLTDAFCWLANTCIPKHQNFSLIFCQPAAP